MNVVLASQIAASVTLACQFANPNLERLRRAVTVRAEHMRMNQLNQLSKHTTSRCFGTATGPSLFDYDKIRYTKDVGIRMVEFNRPKKLNALTLDMVRHLTPRLHMFESNPIVQAVIFRGNGEKAFCAGGDIRSLYDHALDPETRHLSCDFFREEYRLNYLLATMKTPVISFLNGITMGGGVGLSVHGHFRIATENTVFAMPETSIGFFPDVGGSHFLPRLGRRLMSSPKPTFQDIVMPKAAVIPGQGLGTYLALSGEKLRGEEVSALGVATHCVPSNRYELLIHALTGLELKDSMSDAFKYQMIADTIAEFSEDDLIMDDDHDHNVNPEFLDTVESIFGAQENQDDSVSGILARLEAHDSDWARTTLETLERVSPLSLAVTHRQMREGASKTIRECLEMEYRIGCRMMENPDFIEGVRSVIVDKCNNPSWSHAHVDEVTEAQVDAFFQPLPEAQELILYPATTTG